MVEPLSGRAWSLGCAFELEEPESLMVPFIRLICVGHLLCDRKLSHLLPGTREDLLARAQVK